MRGTGEERVGTTEKDKGVLSPGRAGPQRVESDKQRKPQILSSCGLRNGSRIEPSPLCFFETLEFLPTEQKESPKHTYFLSQHIFDNPSVLPFPRL